MPGWLTFGPPGDLNVNHSAPRYPSPNRRRSKGRGAGPLGGHPLRLARRPPGVDDLAEAAEAEDEEQRREAQREAERRDRDLLADGVGGDRRAGRGAGEDLDEERLLDARAAGREGHDGGDGVDTQDEQDVAHRPADVERL